MPELAEFAKDPRDQSWATQAEKYLRSALEGAKEGGVDLVRKIECHRAACIVGGIDANGVLSAAIQAAAWSGGKSEGGTIRSDGCYDELAIFWRNARDFPGAPGGRVTSMAELRCKAAVPCSGEPTPECRVANNCFDDCDLACKCACLATGIPEPRCGNLPSGHAQRPGYVSCAEDPRHFGMKWPPHLEAP